MAKFTFVGIVVLTLTIGNIHNTSAIINSNCCPKVLEMLKEIKDLLLKTPSGQLPSGPSSSHPSPSGQSPSRPSPSGQSPSICRPIKASALNVNNPKKVIPNIAYAYGAVACGNDVYISSMSDLHVYHFDQEGILKEKVKVPTGGPSFMDIHDGKLYVTDRASTVYTRPLSGNQCFTKFLTLNTAPIGIKVSDDRIFVGQFRPGAVRVYNRFFALVHTINAGHRYTQEIGFDLEGNILFSADTSIIYMYNKNLKLIRKQAIKGASMIDGFYVHCDGTMILAMKITN